MTFILSEVIIIIIIFPNERFFLSFLLSVLTHAIYYLRPADYGAGHRLTSLSGGGEEKRQSKWQDVGAVARERGAQMKFRAPRGLSAAGPGQGRAT